MNRIIKFRVWDKSKNNFLNKTPGTHCFSEYYLDLEGGGLVRFDGSYTDHEERYSRADNVDYYFKGTKIIKESPYVITQFTGLVDKNGVEIYDGDILKYSYQSSIYIGRKLNEQGKDIGAKYSEEKYDFHILYRVYWYNDTLEINDGEYFSLLNGWATEEISNSKYDMEKTQYCDKGQIRALGANFSENNGYGNYGTCSQKCEVIGNIFQNKELLDNE